MKSQSDSTMTFVKLALVLGGGYYLVKASGLQLPSFFGGGAPAPAPGGSATAASGINTTAGGSATAASGTTTTAGGSATAASGTAATQHQQVTASEAQIKAAAAGDMAAAAALDQLGVKFNADQWSWYREQVTGQPTTVDLFPPTDRAYLMLATEYLASRAAHGLSGGRGLGEILTGLRTYFPLPLAYANDRSPIIPVQISQMVN